jgi:hypothetical protein
MFCRKCDQFYFAGEPHSCFGFGLKIHDIPKQTFTWPTAPWTRTDAIMGRGGHGKFCKCWDCMHEFPK